MSHLIAAMKESGCVPECAVLIDDCSGYSNVDWPAHWHIHRSDEHLEVQKALNHLFALYPNEKSYGLLTDHARPLSSDWASELEETAGSWRIALCNDVRNRFNLHTGFRRITAAHCIGGELVRALGFVYPAFCVHLAGDDAMEEIGHELGLVAWREDVVVNDLHFSDGEIPRDANHNRVYQGKPFAESDWQAFLEWKSAEKPCLLDRLQAVIPASEMRSPEIAKGTAPLTICCVKGGDLYGPEYVNNLFDMVSRNLRAMPGRFVCFTDDASGIDTRVQCEPLPLSLEGWWNKLYLFKPGVFKEGERVLYFDLDTLILGDIDEIAGFIAPFAMLRDFYRPDHWASGVMAFTVGKETAQIWNRWLSANKLRIDGGDQAWIEKILIERSIKPELLQDIFPGQFVSYKADCLGVAPKRGTRIVCFHGHPRPHECGADWVKGVWRVGGWTASEVSTYCNTAASKLWANIEHALKQDYPRMKECVAHDRHAVIVGGAPSLKDKSREIGERALNGQDVFALNNAARFLHDRGLVPGYQVMMDARAQNESFVTPRSAAKFLFASQVHPSVFAKVDPQSVLLWNCEIPGFRDRYPKEMTISGGTTVLTRAMVCAYAMGYRTIHLYGADSSFSGSDHHAYAQEMNDLDKPCEVIVEGRAFRAAQWMIAQVYEFQSVAAMLADLDCVITVHGDGLLPFVAREMMRQAA